MNEALTEQVARRLAQLTSAPRILVAVSGGPDSVALLDLLVRGRVQHGRSLVVGHVDHGIAPDSHQVAAQVADLADRFGLPYHHARLELGARATETLARRHRRAALRSLAREADCQAIVLAHHADDQAETVLLRVLRGSGPAGLAGMAPRRGPWVRPLLEVDRAALQAHLEAAGLSAWQDPANRDPKHLRSWLRMVVLPLLMEREPAVRDRLLDVARHAARERSAWNQVPELLDGLELRSDGTTISVAAERLRGYRSEVQQAVLSALGRRFGVPLGRVRTATVERLLAGGRSGARVQLGAALEAELAFDRLILRRAAVGFAAVSLVPGGEVQAGRYWFRVAIGAEAGEPLQRQGHHTRLAAGEYLLRPWRPGDRIRPLGGRGSRPVAETFKEARVPRGDRSGWPVVVSRDDDATIVWVPGICRSDARMPEPGAEALDVECDLV